MNARASVKAGLALLSIALGSAALAADPQIPHWYVYGGFSMTTGTTSDYLENGWDVGFGVIWHPGPSHFAVRGDLQYDYWDATHKLLSLAANDDVRVDDGRGSMWALTVDALLEFGHPDHVGGYVGLGIGGYRRYVELTNTVLVSGIYCDPWWGYCWETVFPGDVIQANDTLTKFGYNAVVGVTFPAGHGTMFVEGRYHRMDSEVATEYIPISIGYRF